jgi:hypothetical protein
MKQSPNLMLVASLALAPTPSTVVGWLMEAGAILFVGYVMTLMRADLKQRVSGFIRDAVNDGTPTAGADSARGKRKTRRRSRTANTPPRVTRGARDRHCPEDDGPHDVPTTAKPRRARRSRRTDNDASA